MAAPTGRSAWCGASLTSTWRPASRPGRPAQSATAVRAVSAGQVRAFGAHHVHDVRNSSAGSVAVSVHAYSPPLSAMTRYDLTPGGLVPSRTEGADDW